MTEQASGIPSSRAAARRARTGRPLHVRLGESESAWRARMGGAVGRATGVVAWVTDWFPVRAWRHVLRSNGFLLAAGISYQSLFAFFAGLYFVIAMAGIWLGGSKGAVDGLVAFVNSYVPGFIGDRGVIRRDQVQDIAEQSAGLLSVTGAVALLIVVWTAIGFVTFTRRGVAAIFELPFDTRGYFRLKARDFVAAVAFGLALILGWVLSGVATWAVDLLFQLIGLESRQVWAHVVGRIVVVLAIFAIDTVALIALFRLLLGTDLSNRSLLPGSIAGAAALALLQLLGGLLIGYSPRNPLLATFAISAGLLLWFRIMGIIILAAAGWIAVAAYDRGSRTEMADAEE